MTNSEEIQFLTLPLGEIKGLKKTTLYDDSYYSFEGIPYAKPPLGELRFRAPQPIEPWTGVKDCRHFTNKPVQRNAYTGKIEGTEDCLYLNVYAKTLKSEKPLPVMFYIYGGGFYMGAGTRATFGPDYFMSEDVVLILFNYRLCSLGFLSLKDPEVQVPGNAGLKDQILALKWVKQYISHFNGDPNNITVFGESAGGASTHFLSATEQTRGLFHKTIPMSGCVLNDWAHLPQTDEGYRLAKYHGYTGENVDKDVLAYLRTLEPLKLLDHAIVTDSDRRSGKLFPFAPVIEPYIGEDCVIPKPTIEMLKTSWSNDIPMMLGGTSDEGLVMYLRLKASPESIDRVQQHPAMLLPHEVRETHTPEEVQKLTQELVELYFGDKQISFETRFNLLNFYGYKVIWHGLHRTILSRLSYGKAPTYLYRFAFDSNDFNHHRKRYCGDDPVRGAAHADELSYLFVFPETVKVSKDSAEYKTIRRMIGIWTTFAKTANPNCDEIKEVKWLPVEETNPNLAINIAEDVEFKEIPEKSKLLFWDKLYKDGHLY